MSHPSKSKLVEIVIKALPYAEQMRGLDLDSESDAIRFGWRGHTFRVSGDCRCEEVDRSMLCGSDIAILLEALLKRTYVSILNSEGKKP